MTTVASTMMLEAQSLAMAATSPTSRRAMAVNPMFLLPMVGNRMCHPRMAGSRIHHRSMLETSLTHRLPTQAPAEEQTSTTTRPTAGPVDFSVLGPGAVVRKGFVPRRRFSLTATQTA